MTLWTTDLREHRSKIAEEKGLSQLNNLDSIESGNLSRIYRKCKLKWKLNFLVATDKDFIVPENRTWFLSIQLILLIHGFCLCEFTYSLNFIWNSKINTYSTFVVICRHMQSGEIFGHPTGTFPEDVKQGSILPSCFSSHAVNKHPFWGLSDTLFFVFLCFLWWFCCFEWPPKIVLKCCLVLWSSRRLPCALQRKILDELHSGVSYRTVGSEFNVNESTIHIE